MTTLCSLPLKEAPRGASPGVQWLSLPSGAGAVGLTPGPEDPTGLRAAGPVGPDD